MLSTLYSERFALVDGSKSLKSRIGGQLDEILVFALVVVAVLYIAAASCWFVL